MKKVFELVSKSFNDVSDDVTKTMMVKWRKQQSIGESKQQSFWNIER